MFITDHTSGGSSNLSCGTIFTDVSPGGVRCFSMSAKMTDAYPWSVMFTKRNVLVAHKNKPKSNLLPWSVLWQTTRKSHITDHCINDHHGRRWSFLDWIHSVMFRVSWFSRKLNGKNSPLCVRLIGLMCFINKKKFMFCNTILKLFSLNQISI